MIQWFDLFLERTGPRTDLLEQFFKSFWMVEGLVHTSLEQGEFWNQTALGSNSGSSDLPARLT